MLDLDEESSEYVRYNPKYKYNGRFIHYIKFKDSLDQLSLSYVVSNPVMKEEYFVYQVEGINMIDKVTKLKVERRFSHFH